MCNFYYIYSMCVLTNCVQYLDSSLGIRQQGHSVEGGTIFDTIKVTAVKGDIRDVLKRAEEKRINIRQFENGSVSKIGMHC